MLMSKQYDFQSIEKKWLNEWEKERLYDIDIKDADNHYYCLDMYPYPSGDGLHVGHWRGYVLSDFYTRYQRLLGKTVLHPMGFDSFGLPAENAAIKHKSHPKHFTDQAIENFTRQLKQLGASFDWSKKVVTSDPIYYKWTQWLFLQFFKHGLAEKRTSLVNWCPKDQTVLANEQVKDGCCERCGTRVTKKELSQWYIKTTALAQELLDVLDKLDWPENVKILQRNWIGRSEGASIIFETWENPELKVEVFTTRPDTIYGVTGVVLAPEHPLAKDFVTKDNQAGYEKYLSEVAAKTNIDRSQTKETEKTAFFTGSYLKHPLTGKKVEVWLADYVLLDYGTGAVMSVPAHDERDFMFAKAHNLPIITVIEPVTGEVRENEEKRHSIVAIVEDPKTEKILSINWGPKLGGNLFVGGGIEGDEDPVAAARREILEETGYKNVKLVSQTETVHHHYIAHSKNVNRNIEAIGLHFTLEDDARQEQTLNENEADKFEVEWLTKPEAQNRVKDELHAYCFNRLINDQPYVSHGILVNSEEFSGLTSQEGGRKIVEKLSKIGAGKSAITYRLRDWLVSRQRYWGAPIPIVYDPEGKPHAVKDEHLPVLLPEDVDFLPGGESPIARSLEYVERAEKLYGMGWHFDTDTLDTFVDSSWYFLRYLTPNDENQAFDKDLVKKWLPVDLYIGGIEHATGHMLYSRFVYHFLTKFGYLESGDGEPFKRHFNIGMITLHGAKMSKSKGNSISPDPLIEHYGTDALRGYELFIGPMEIEAEWNVRGINGVHKFLIKVNELQDNLAAQADPAVQARFNEYLEAITPMIEGLRLNTYLAEAMKFVNDIAGKDIDKDVLSKFVITLSPIFPFLGEEIWHNLANTSSVFKSHWPEKLAGVKETKTKQVILQGAKPVFLGSVAIIDDKADENALESLLESKNIDKSSSTIIEKDRAIIVISKK